MWKVPKNHICIVNLIAVLSVLSESVYTISRVVDTFGCIEIITINVDMRDPLIVFDKMQWLPISAD